MEQVPKIVQQRLQGTQKPGLHPDPDLLAAFVEKSLNDRERAAILKHLGDCADCRAVTSLAMPQVELSPSPRALRSSWLSWPLLRWGALAACAVVVGAAVTLHYDRRQTVEPNFADSVPATPAGPAESESLNSPNQKLAAKTASPSPFPSDRDFGTAAGKLSRQREKSTAAGMAGGAESSASPVMVLNEPENSREVAGSRLASSDAMKSADKPAQSAGRLALAVPVPSKPAMTPGVEPGTNAAMTRMRNDGLDSVATVSTQPVAAEAAVPRAQSTEQKAKDESSKEWSHEGGPSKEELRSEVQNKGGATSNSGAAALSLGDRKQDSLALKKMQNESGQYAGISPARNQRGPRWTLSAGGMLQRSFDSGKTWQPIPIAGHVVIRALAANDSDIWAGGASGALFHSHDAGEHWVQVKPVADGRPLTSDITGVEFSDAQHGKLTTTNRETQVTETWTTDDAGSTWQIH